MSLPFIKRARLSLPALLALASPAALAGGQLLDLPLSDGSGLGAPEIIWAISALSYATSAALATIAAGLVLARRRKTLTALPGQAPALSEPITLALLALALLALPSLIGAASYGKGTPPQIASSLHPLR